MDIHVGVDEVREVGRLQTISKMDSSDLHSSLAFLRRCSSSVMKPDAT